MSIHKFTGGFWHNKVKSFSLPFCIRLSLVQLHLSWSGFFFFFSACPCSWTIHPGLHVIEWQCHEFYMWKNESLLNLKIKLYRVNIFGLHRMEMTLNLLFRCLLVEGSQGAGAAQCDLGGGHGQCCPRDPVTDKKTKMDGWIYYFLTQQIKAESFSPLLPA